MRFVPLQRLAEQARRFHTMAMIGIASDEIAFRDAVKRYHQFIRRAMLFYRRADTVGQRFDIGRMVMQGGAVRMAGCQRKSSAHLKSSSLTVAVVEAAYCGYSGTTTICVHPASCKAFKRSGIDG